MLIQDALTGRLHEIPDQLYRSYLGEYGQLYERQYPQGYGHSPHYAAGQVVYDGLGNPVGIAPLLAMLAPLAAKVLPAIATKVLPAITKALPAISSILPGAAAGPPQAPPVMSQPQPPGAMPPPESPFPPPPAPVQAPAPPMMATPAPMPIQTPLPPTMAPLQRMPVPYPMTMMAPRVIRGRRRSGRRPVRRRIAVPPPPQPEVLEPVREARSAEPPSPVQGWGYYGGFNGYGRR
jgi:hypothetical protein